MAKSNTGTFDPYREWLGIADGVRPPDHFTLLGVSAIEKDTKKIRDAARERMKRVRPNCLKYPAEGTRILNEIAAAQVCLLDPASAEAYRQSLQPRTKGAAPPEAPKPAPPARPTWTEEEKSSATYAVSWAKGDRIPINTADLPVGISLSLTTYSLAHIGEDCRVAVPAVTQRVPLVVARGPKGMAVGEVALAMHTQGKAKAVRTMHRHLGEPGYVFAIDDKEFSPEFLSAMVLQQPLEAVEKQSIAINSGVISVPHFFTRAQRESVEQIGQRAGLGNASLLDDPISVALAFADTCCEGGLSTGKQLWDVYRDDLLLVIDLEEVLFEASLLRLSKRGKMEILGSEVARKLGSKNWSDILMGMVCTAFEEETEEDPRELPEVFKPLQLKVLSALTRIRSKQQTRIELSYDGEPLNLILEREDFEDEIRPLLDTFEETVERLFEEEDVRKRIRGVILAGDATVLGFLKPVIKDMVSAKADLMDAPSQAKARGAALHGLLQWTSRHKIRA